MPNSFLTPKPISGKPLKAVANNLAFIKNVGPKPKSSGFLGEVAQQTRRMSGVTPRAIRSFAEKPASYIKKQKFNLSSIGKVK